MGKVRSQIDYILKHNMFIQLFYKLVMSSFFKFIGIFLRTDERLVLFNAHGRKYNDSPKAIFEYMVKNDKYKDFKFVWAFDVPSNYNIPGCSKVKMDTMKYFITALKAKYWVSCVNIERGLAFKKKQTIYLNTWHGTPLKHVGNAVSGRRDFDFSDINVFCCAGEYEKAIYMRDFNVTEDSLLLSGLPRNDELYYVSNNQMLDLRNKLNIPNGKKVILYAPTWRNSKNNGKSYSFEPPIDISFWQKELGSEYVLLLRTHAYTNDLLGIEFNEFVRDASEYPNINDLLMVADVLVSDYSATIFDYSILEKPIICFGYDYDEYVKDRGLYINLEEELPSGVIKSQEDVIRKIKVMDYKEECRKTSEFKMKYLQVGGRATEECVKRLIR